MFTRANLSVFISCFIMALILCLDVAGEYPVLRTLAIGMHYGDALFHELGHSIMAWLVGIPSIPSLLTLIGANQAAGFALMFDRNIAVQVMVLMGLAGWAILLWRDEEKFSAFCLIGLIILSIVISLIGLHEAMVSYMGHGASIIMGGYLLYRALSRHPDVPNKLERWLNAFFGFYLILHSAIMSWRIVFDDIYRMKYTSHMVGGVTHNDFVAITEQLHSISIDMVCYFTMGLCILATLVAAVSAYRKVVFYED